MEKCLFIAEKDRLVNVEWTSFSQACKSVLAGIASTFSENNTDEIPTRLDRVEILSLRMDEMCASFTSLMNNTNSNQESWHSLVDVVACITPIQRTLSDEVELLQGINDERTCRCPTQQTVNRPGRPKYEIKQSQLEFLRSKHFSWVNIAKLLHVSTRTLRRRKHELGIDEEDFTDISETELIQVMEDVRKATPNIDQSRMIGALRSRGLRIQRRRVRACLRRIDPIGTALR